MLIGVLSVLLLLPFASEAQTVATVANSVLNNIKSVPQLIGSISYVCGVALGVMSLLKFKEHNETKGQVKITSGIIYLLCSIILLSLPTVMNVGMETFGYDKAGQSTQKYNY
jgi:Ca2+/Na+ antiporter